MNQPLGAYFYISKRYPVRMVSMGGSQHNVSILVPSEVKKEALIALNGLFAIKHAEVLA